MSKYLPFLCSLMTAQRSALISKNTTTRSRCVEPSVNSIGPHRYPLDCSGPLTFFKDSQPGSLGSQVQPTRIAISSLSAVSRACSIVVVLHGLAAALVTPINSVSGGMPLSGTIRTPGLSERLLALPGRAKSTEKHGSTGVGSGEAIEAETFVCGPDGPHYNCHSAA